MTRRLAGIIITHGNKILILQRHDNSWDLPKGGIERFERPVDAAIRETLEETGIRINRYNLLGPRIYTLPRAKLWLYKYNARSKNVILSDEHKNYRWVNYSTALRLLYRPLARIIKEARKDNILEDSYKDYSKMRRKDKPSYTVVIGVPFDLAKDFPVYKSSGHEPHITLLHIGHVPRGKLSVVNRCIQRVARKAKPFTVDLSHFGKLITDSGQVVAYMAPSPISKLNLAKLHGDLRRELENSGVKVEHSYGKKSHCKLKLPYEILYKPHATLAYLDGLCAGYDGPMPTGSWRVSEIECRGAEKHRIPLGSNRYDQPGSGKSLVSLGRYPRAVSEDTIPGGLADKSKPEDFDQDELEKGIAAELEHTSSKKIAREIAMDHLKEDPRYYSKLEKFHKLMKGERKPVAIVIRRTSLSIARPVNSPGSCPGNKSIGQRKIAEGETSLKGYERHPTPAGNAGGLFGSPGLAGSLEMLEFLKKGDRKRLLKLYGLAR